MNCFSVGCLLNDFVDCVFCCYEYKLVLIVSSSVFFITLIVVNDDLFCCFVGMVLVGWVGLLCCVECFCL